LKIYETPKFQRLSKKLRTDVEKQALKKAIEDLAATPMAGKKLKGEFKEFRSYSYSVTGQARRLIYQVTETAMYLISSGPREGIYN
jgi:mRNA-degrading endonuclease YafQ of YafQ-DinJ toxin-antitoxin module